MPQHSDFFLTHFITDKFGYNHYLRLWNLTKN